MAKNYMKISTNFSQFPELKLDEQQIKNCVRKHFGTIKAPIYLYIDHKLKTAHGLHAARNMNHFHKISLSYKHLSEAKSSAIKKSVECKDWTFPEWPRTHRFYHSYLITLLTHELQHARQVEQGVQYRRENWMGYDERIEDKDPTEYDACMAEFKKADKMLRSYCER